MRTAIGIFAAVLLAAGGMAMLGIDANHDGVILKPAWDMANGKVLFRDVFSHYGPLTSYIHLGALTIFGKRLLVLKMTAAVAYAITAVVIWGLSREVMGKRAAVITTLGWLLLAPFYIEPFYVWPSVYAALAQSILVWLLLKEKWGWAGLFAGIAFGFKQPYLILVPVLIIVMGKKAVKAGIGWTIAAALFMLPILVSGGLVDYFKQNIWIGYINGRVLGSQMNYPAVLRFLGLHPLWAVIPIAGLAVEWGWRKNKKLAAAGLMALAGVIQYLPLLDFSHMFWAVTPMWWMAGYGFIKLSRHKKIWVIIAGLLLAGELGIRAEGAVNKINKNNIKITRPEILAGMKVTAGEEKFYREAAGEIDGYLQTYPEKRLVILGSDALYMTFTDKARNTLTMYADYSGVTSGVYRYNDELTRYIMSAKPLVLADRKYPLPAGFYLIKEWPDYDKKLFGDLSRFAGL